MIKNCLLFERLMTDFSFDEHEQPILSPVPITSHENLIKEI